MKLGFIFDTRFKKYGDDYYSTNLSVELIRNRYLTVFDEIVIVGRCEELTENPEGKYVKGNSDNIYFDCISNASPVRRIINFKKDNEKILSIIDQCDAVISRGWRGALLCQKRKKSYLIEVVNCSWDAYWNHGWMGKCVAPIMYLLQKKAIAQAPYVIYVTHDFLQKRYPSTGRSTAISDVDLLSVDADILNKRIKKINGKTADSIIVLGTAGAVNVPYKGQRYVIGAMAILKKRGYSNFIYKLAGSGDNSRLYEYAKKKNVLDQIVFSGSIAHEQMNEWYDSLDIYVQPSLQEGLPRALIEAMNRALPCYGTATGGIPELLDEQCICKNNFDLEKRIANLLEKYNKSNAVSWAIKNYNEAQKYEREILYDKLHEFLFEYVNNIQETN